MSKITKLQFSGLKGQNRNIELTGMDVFLGPNGTGKSAHLQAFVIGMLGYDPVLANTPGLGKQPTSTLTLAKDNEIYIRMETDEGFVFSRRFSRNQKTGTCSQKITVESEPELGSTDADKRIKEVLGDFAVMFDIRSFFGLSPDKRRAFLSPYLPPIDITITDRVLYRIYENLLPEGVLKTTLKLKYNAIEPDSLFQSSDLTNKFFKDCDSFVQDEPGIHFGSFWESIKNLYRIKEGSISGDEWLKQSIVYLAEYTKDNKRKIKDLESSISGMLSKKQNQNVNIESLVEMKQKRDALVAEKEKLIALEAQERQKYDQNKRVREKIASISDSVAKMKEEKSEIDNVALQDKLDDQEFQCDKLTAQHEKANQEANLHWSLLSGIKDKLASASASFIGDVKSIKQKPLSLQNIECPQCGHFFNYASPVDDKITETHTLINDLVAEKEKKEEEYAQAHDQSNTYGAMIQVLTKSIHESRSDILDYNDIIRNIGRYEESLIDLQKQIQDNTSTINPEFIMQQKKGLVAQIETLETEINKAHKIKGLIEEISSSKIALDIEEKNKEMLKKISAAIIEVKNKEVESLADKITARANEFLAMIDDNLEMGVVLNDINEKPIFDVQLKKDGVWRSLPVLSGGESVIAASIALAVSLIDLAGETVKCRVLSLEAAEVDYDRFEKMLSSVQRFYDKGYLDNVLVATWATENIQPKVPESYQSFLLKKE